MTTDPRPVLCRLRREIERRPGLTAAELASALFGPNAAVSRLQLALSLLERRDAVQRRGEGGREDPYRYFSPRAARPDPETDIPGTEATGGHLRIRARIQ